MQFSRFDFEDDVVKGNNDRDDKDNGSNDYINGIYVHNNNNDDNCVIATKAASIGLMLFVFMFVCNEKLLMSILVPLL